MTPARRPRPQVSVTSPTLAVWSGSTSTESLRTGSQYLHSITTWCAPGRMPGMVKAPVASALPSIELSIRMVTSDRNRSPTATPVASKATVPEIDPGSALGFFGSSGLSRSRLMGQPASASRASTARKRAMVLVPCPGRVERLPVDERVRDVDQPHARGQAQRHVPRRVQALLLTQLLLLERQGGAGA